MNQANVAWEKGTKIFTWAINRERWNVWEKMKQHITKKQWKGRGNRRSIPRRANMTRGVRESQKTEKEEEGMLVISVSTSDKAEAHKRWIGAAMLSGSFSSQQTFLWFLVQSMYFIQLMKTGSCILLYWHHSDTNDNGLWLTRETWYVFCDSAACLKHKQRSCVVC